MTQEGFAIWFTGLPCSGKSTLAKMLIDVLRVDGRRVEGLDGDEVRQHLTKGLGYSKADRDENIRRIGYLAHLLCRNGVVVVGATISPYRETRDEVRRKIGQFIEIYVKCDLEVCVARDVKGMYKKAKDGDIANFTGISDPYEPPLKPEITVETDKETTDESLNKILDGLAKLNYLERDPPRKVR